MRSASSGKRSSSVVLYSHQLSYEEGKISACGQSLKLFDNSEKFFETGALEQRQLIDMDVVLMRQIHPLIWCISPQRTIGNVARKNLMVNNPAEVRNAPGNFVTRFADLMPPTVICRDLNVIRAFRKNIRYNYKASVWEWQEFSDFNLAIRI